MSFTVRTLVSLLALLLALATPAAAQVAFEGTVGSGNCRADTSPLCTASNTTLTYSHTTGAAANRVLVVGVCLAAGSTATQPAISSVIFGGTHTLTSRHKHQVSTFYYCQIFSSPDGVMPAASTTANVVIVTASAIPASNSTITSAALNFSGVDQTTPWTSVTNGANGTSTTAALTISASGATDMGVHFECNGTSVSATVGTNETSRFVSAANTFGACNTFGVATATGGDTAFSRTVGSDSWIMVGGALKASGVAAPRNRFSVY